VYLGVRLARHKRQRPPYRARSTEHAGGLDHTVSHTDRPAPHGSVGHRDRHLADSPSALRPAFSAPPLRRPPSCQGGRRGFKSLLPLQNPGGTVLVGARRSLREPTKRCEERCERRRSVAALEWCARDFPKDRPKVLKPVRRATPPTQSVTRTRTHHPEKLAGTPAETVAIEPRDQNQIEPSSFCEALRQSRQRLGSTKRNNRL